MKKILILVLLLQTALSSFSQTAWKSISSLPPGSAGSATFTIDSSGKGYIVGGDGFSEYDQGIWEYDPVTDTWNQGAWYPDVNCVYLVAFSLNGVGYVGTGEGPGNSLTNAFYKYDPSVNTWTTIPSLPAAARCQATAFTLNGKAYVGGGMNGSNKNQLNDFYSFDPLSNKWDTIASFPGNPVLAASFAIENIGYVCCGGYLRKGSVTDHPGNDFWEYAPLTNTWTKEANFPGNPRYGSIGFAIADSGYIGLGSADSGHISLASIDSTPNRFLSDIWKFNVSTNSWSLIDTFPGGERTMASAFTIGNNAYIGAGYETGTGYNPYFWKFSTTVFHAHAVANNDSICPGGNISFSSSANFDIKKWNWSFPGGSPASSTSNAPTISYSTPGNYPVYLTANDDSGHTVFDTIKIKITQSASIGQFSSLYDTTCNNGALAELTLFNTVGHIQWQSSTNDTSFFQNILGDTLNSISGQFLQTTYFRAIATYGGCSADTSKTATIFVEAYSQLSVKFVINGLQVSCTPNVYSNLDQYAWSFGDGSTSNDISPVHTYNSSGNYRIVLYFTTPGGCSTTYEANISVSPDSINHCNASFNIYADSITPHHYYLVPNVKGQSPISYAWQWGDGMTGIGDTASHVYAAAGFYNICLTITDDTACASTYCDSSTYLFRMEDGNTIVYVNVVNSIVSGISSVSVNNNNLVILPNPCSTCEVKGVNSIINDMVISDMLGRTINVSFAKSADGYSLNLPNGITGMFILRNVKTGQVVKFVRE